MGNSSAAGAGAGSGFGQTAYGTAGANATAADGAGNYAFAKGTGALDARVFCCVVLGFTGRGHPRHALMSRCAHNKQFSGWQLMQNFSCTGSDRQFWIAAFYYNVSRK